jgi:hypothetical protein
MLGLKGLKIGIQVKLLNNTTTKHSEVTMTEYIIVDIVSQEFFKDVDGNVKIFEDYYNALLHCGIYEFENAWVCELKHNHIEDNE